MRLSHYLSTAGVASRRACDDIIKAGRVRVNGEAVTQPGRDVQEGQDRVEVDGSPVVGKDFQPQVYIMLHKPVGVLSTMARGKEQGPCIADMVKVPQRVFPVGRLDQDSSGLILLTDDGELTNRLTHPRHQVQKEYEVKIQPAFRESDVAKLARGVAIDGRPVEIDNLVMVSTTKLRLTIHEGRKRIVRRLFRELKYQVLELKRIRIGGVSLGRLAIGKWRKLTCEEVARLHSSK